MLGEHPGIFNLIQSSHVLWSLGYPEQAHDRAKSALDKADEVNRPYIQAICAFINAMIAIFTGDLQACFQHAKKCIALGEKYGLMQFAGETKTLLGSALVQAGETVEGFRKIHEALQWRIQNNVMTGLHLHLTAQAAMYLHIGDVDAGLQAVEKDLEFSEKYDDQYFLSETYRLKGELLWMKYKEVRSREIGECFEKSMQLAKKQQAKSFELRTAMSIAKWWSAQGKEVKAFKLLSEVYEWFTEGFETQDLKEARQLIDKMSATAIALNS
jgi:tetratricopeptide (TPR) repeat protein